jgi:hypothetical protein
METATERNTMARPYTHRVKTLKSQWMQMRERICNAEGAYLAHAEQAELAPHRWGEEQEAELGRLAEELQRLYDEEGTKQYDRIAL